MHPGHLSWIPQMMLKLKHGISFQLYTCYMSIFGIFVNFQVGNYPNRKNVSIYHKMRSFKRSVEKTVKYPKPPRSAWIPV